MLDSVSFDGSTIAGQDTAIKENQPRVANSPSCTCSGDSCIPVESVVLLQYEYLRTSGGGACYQCLWISDSAWRGPDAGGSAGGISQCSTRNCVIGAFAGGGFVTHRNRHTNRGGAGDIGCCWWPDSGRCCDINQTQSGTHGTVALLRWFPKRVYHRSRTTKRIRPRSSGCRCPTGRGRV